MTVDEKQNSHDTSASDKNMQDTTTPARRSKGHAWIEAMRLRTLPVSMAGVAAGCGCAAYYGSFRLLPALICLLFALLAQIASNFATEY